MNIISKKFYEIILNQKQKSINKEYNKNGLTDEVLQKQVELNTKRNELNIPDANQYIYENFVQ